MVDIKKKTMLYYSMWLDTSFLNLGNEIHLSVMNLFTLYNFFKGILFCYSNWKIIKNIEIIDSEAVLIQIKKNCQVGETVPSFKI